MLTRSLRIPAIRGVFATISSSSASSSSSSSLLARQISPVLRQTRFLSQEVRTAIDRAVASAPVVLFMKGTPETPQCGFSRATIQLLGQQGLDPTKFTAFNVLEDEELRAVVVLDTKEQYPTDTSIGIKEYSDWPTIPQLYVDKEFIGGCDILMGMHKDGSLAELLTQKKLIVEMEDSKDGSS